MIDPILPLMFVMFTLGMVWGFGALVLWSKWLDHRLKVKRMEAEAKFIGNLDLQPLSALFGREPEPKEKELH